MRKSQIIIFTLISLIVFFGGCQKNEKDNLTKEKELQQSSHDQKLYKMAEVAEECFSSLSYKLIKDFPELQNANKDLLQEKIEDVLQLLIGDESLNFDDPNELFLFGDPQKMIIEQERNNITSGYTFYFMFFSDYSVFESLDKEKFELSIEGNCASNTNKLVELIEREFNKYSDSDLNSKIVLSKLKESIDESLQNYIISINSNNKFSDNKKIAMALSAALARASNKILFTENIDLYKKRSFLQSKICLNSGLVSGLFNFVAEDKDINYNDLAISLDDIPMIASTIGVVSYLK
ncbi:MAG: hypothetical protein ACEPOW_07470 [Bacteroidales bacterium]